MAKKARRSSVIELLDLVYAAANDATSHSYERLNRAMSNALQLAIGSGFKFATGDVEYILSNYKAGYWVGESDEWIYGEAIEVGNTSAIASYEAAKKREGIIADDVDFRESRNPYLHMSGTRQRERLCVGATFVYRGQKLKVTSFADDSSYVNACLYVKVDEYRSKVSKRLKLTRDDIIADRAERKERKKQLELLADAGTKNGTTAEIVKALGVKTRDDYAQLSIEKIRKVAKKFLGEVAA
jgi:hypothetical protein